MVDNVYQTDISSDGESLLLSHRFNSFIHNQEGRVENALSIWSEDNFRTVFNTIRYDRDYRDYIHGWLNNKNLVVFEDNLEGVSQRTTQLRKGDVPDENNVVPELITDEVVYKAQFKPFKIGNYLVHNWQTDDRANFVIDLSQNAPAQEIKLSDPFGNNGHLDYIAAMSQVNPEKSVLYAAFWNGSQFTGRGFVTIDHDSLNISLLHNLSDVVSTNRISLQTVGDTSITYVVSNTNEVYAFDNIALIPLSNGDSILDDTIAQDLVLSGTKLYAGGIQVIGNQNGQPKEFFFDQVSQEWTEEPLDRSEIGESIPLMPSN